MPRTNKPANGSTGSPRGNREAPRGNGEADPFNDPDAIARRAYEIYQACGEHGRISMIGSKPSGS